MCGESSGTTDEAPVMGVEEQPRVKLRFKYKQVSKRSFE
jgi:hypothetical protein